VGFQEVAKKIPPNPPLGKGGLAVNNFRNYANFRLSSHISPAIEKEVSSFKKQIRKRRF
jgi:hypothetical protein